MFPQPSEEITRCPESIESNYSCSLSCLQERRSPSTAQLSLIFRHYSWLAIPRSSEQRQPKRNQSSCVSYRSPSLSRTRCRTSHRRTSPVPDVRLTSRLRRAHRLTLSRFDLPGPFPVHCFGKTCPMTHPPLGFLCLLNYRYTQNTCRLFLSSILTYLPMRRPDPILAPTRKLEAHGKTCKSRNCSRLEGVLVSYISK